MNDILNIADSAEDVEEKAGKGFEPPREGVALLRMCSYIELGTYEGEWKGKIKHNRKCLVEFELLHPDHAIRNKEGQFIGYHKIMLRINKSGHAKSRYMALFNCLNYDGTIRVEKDKVPALSKFLGEPYLGKVYHSKDAKNDKTYANLDKDGVYSITAPRTPVMEMGMPTDKFEAITVPEMNSAPRLFLWEAPNMSPKNYHAMWESIYVEGEREDGTSKNWIQNMILSDENEALPDSQAEELFVMKGTPFTDPSLA